MLCLGIESSCDDTSLALVQDGRLIDQVASSQVDLHALFGGVVPEMASREHARFIGPLFDTLIKKNRISPQQIDLIAVARGPGLLGSILVGVSFAKALSLGLNVRLIGVHHLHAHLFAAGLEQQLRLPALGLLVSGGHTHLYRIETPDKFSLLGKTLDDAAGEAFDKAGKMLGLPYPAGKHIDVLADEGVPDSGFFPRPYTDNAFLDFSFSGLKTSMAVFLKKHPELQLGWDARTGLLKEMPERKRKAIADVCASYRMAVADTLAIKTRLALQLPEMQDIQSIILAGGVAANTLLRKTMQSIAKDKGLRFTVPSFALCTDNGAMIAYMGWRLALLGFEHSLTMEAIPRGKRMPQDMTRMLGQV